MHALRPLSWSISSVTPKRVPSRDLRRVFAKAADNGNGTVRAEEHTQRQAAPTEKAPNLCTARGLLWDTVGPWRVMDLDE